MKIGPATRGGKIRLAILLLILLAVGYLTRAQVLLYRTGYTPQEGDIVFQSLPHGDLVDAIEGIIHSPYSHCGVVLNERGHWVVIESIGTVRETPLLEWLQQGRSAAFAVYRLKPE